MWRYQVGDEPAGLDLQGEFWAEVENRQNMGGMEMVIEAMGQGGTSWKKWTKGGKKRP